MQPQVDLPQLVDNFLETDKTFAGRPEWNTELNGNVYRWVAPLSVNGEMPGFDITIKSYPHENPITFRIILAHDKAIWRLDFAFDDPHQNSFNAPPDISGQIITGRHYHAWPDNRRFSTARGLPNKLHNARNLPANVQTFENALRWFCGEVRIVDLDAFGIPELPKPGTLL